MRRQPLLSPFRSFLFSSHLFLCFSACVNARPYSQGMPVAADSGRESPGLNAEETSGRDSQETQSHSHREESSSPLKARASPAPAERSPPSPPKPEAAYVVGLKQDTPSLEDNLRPPVLQAPEVFGSLPVGLLAAVELPPAAEGLLPFLPPKWQSAQPYFSLGNLPALGAEAAEFIPEAPGLPGGLALHSPDSTGASPTVDENPAAFFYRRV